YLAYGRARRQFDKFEQVFWSGQSLEELYRSLSERNNTGLAAIFVAAMREWKKSFERGARAEQTDERHGRADGRERSQAGAEKFG
ncbi:hypothetical protein ACC848_41975, partial [Rhizobium johnstonii]